MLQPHAPCFSLPAFLLPRLKPSMLRHLCWLSCLPRASSDRLLLLCTLRPLPLLLRSPGDPHPALSYPYIKISGLLPTKSSQCSLCFLCGGYYSKYVKCILSFNTPKEIKYYFYPYFIHIKNLDGDVKQSKVTQKIAEMYFKSRHSGFLPHPTPQKSVVMPKSLKLNFLHPDLP